MKAAFLAQVDCGFVGTVFDPSRQARIARVAELNPVVFTVENFAQHRAEAAQTEVLFTCWNFPHELLTEENFPALRVIFYTGGSVRFFSRPLLERGVQVVSARSANAVAVAHFCLAQIILACKGYFRNTRESGDLALRKSYKCFTGTGLYGEQIALLGFGTIARELVPLLQQVDLKVLVVDPFLSEAEAKEFGVERVSREEAFARAYVVSNHLPNLPELQRVLDRRLFASLRPNATFINTGRGAQVNEEDLVEVARERPDLTALLDVTEPEPPLAGSPLYETPNIHLTSHIAGAINDEYGRMSDFVLVEFERYAAGQPLLHADALENFDRLA